MSSRERTQAQSASLREVIREGEPLSTEKNREVVRRAFEEVMHHGNLRSVDEMVADNATLSDSPGRKGLRAGMYRSGAPDLHMTVEDVVAEGDQAHRPGSGSGKDGEDPRRKSGAPFRFRNRDHHERPRLGQTVEVGQELDLIVVC